MTALRFHPKGAVKAVETQHTLLTDCRACFPAVRPKSIGSLDASSAPTRRRRRSTSPPGIRTAEERAMLFGQTAKSVGLVQ
jgi:hypothetical protein